MDKLYLDRTFNGQDWFALRQTAMKKKYKTTQEVYDSIKVRVCFLIARVCNSIASLKSAPSEHPPTKQQHQTSSTTQAMLEPLGDPYTRFLPPAQYDSLYGLATGSVAGVGVSLFIDPVGGGTVHGACTTDRGAFPFHAMTSLS